MHMTKNPFGQLGKKLLLLTLLLVTLSISALAADNNYLTFKSEDGKTFTLSMDKAWNGEIEYATSEPENENSWQEWDGTPTPDSQTLYLRGKGNTTITNEGEGYFSFDGDSQAIACTGNIMTLLDYEQVAEGKMPEMDNYCFAYLFDSCSALTSAPELPATTLKEGCYAYMFCGCTALTSAPKLPATMLATYCYADMFSSCSALTSAPELPATTLANYCYADMFFNCSALTGAPKLPATTMTYGCYANMFYNCKALTSASELPATTLAGECYKFMFAGCSNLKVSTTEPTNSNYVVWNFPTTDAYNWNNSMLSGTGGNFTSNPSLGGTYYVACDVDAVCFEGYTVSEIANKCIQFTFDGEIEHPKTQEMTTTLTTKQTLAKLFPQLQYLDGKISFGVTVKGLPNGIHVTGAEFVAPKN